MSKVVNFLGRNYIEPGSYATTVYNPTSVVNVASFGNTMIIDTGLSINGDYEFSGGSGADGELVKGLKSVYEFTSYDDFLAFIGGGPLSKIAEKLFKPMSGAPGIPKLFYTRAAKTEAAKITIPLTVVVGSPTTYLDTDSLVLTCKNEGITGNGVDSSSVLKVGYAANLISGTPKGVTPTFYLQVLKGSYQGIDEAGEPYGAYSFDRAYPEIITNSPSFITLGELYNWAIADKVMNAHFVVTKKGSISASLRSLASYILAAGGTTEFLAGTEYQDILDSITDLDITFHLCTKFGPIHALDTATNGALYNFIKNDAKYREFMVVAGGYDDTDLFGDEDSSEAIAKFYNDSQVVVVHGGPEVLKKGGNGTKGLLPIMFAASVIGINAGMAPQTPLTFKKVGYPSFVYPLKKKERERALQLGILHARVIGGAWCINQGVTSLQDNLKEIADDGSSLELSIELIKSQLNKELLSEGEVRFTGNTAAQSSPETVKNFTETKLNSLVAKPGNDNLLIGWRNVKVVADNGDYKITYDFTPNVPVNKTLFIGNILDFSVQS